MRKTNLAKYRTVIESVLSIIDLPDSKVKILKSVSDNLKRKNKPKRKVKPSPELKKSLKILMKPDTFLEGIENRGK